MKTIQAICFFSFLIIVTGCVSSDYSYREPEPVWKVENSITVKQTKEKVWSKLVRGIGENFFVINNMDKQSGFLNVSYSGDPEKYVIGGYLHYEFSNARGKRVYDFPATKSLAQFETMVGGNYQSVTRKMELEGRMNILITEVDSFNTSITVNTRYILNMTVTGTDAMGRTLIPSQQTITFNTGQSGLSSGKGLYYASGELEKTILDLVRYR